MAKRYGHIGKRSLRNAVNAIAEAAKKWKQKTQERAENESGSLDNPFDLIPAPDSAAVN